MRLVAPSSCCDVYRRGIQFCTSSHVQAAKDFQKAIEVIPELKLVGKPDMCNVAFTGALFSHSAIIPPSTAVNTMLMCDAHLLYRS